MICDCLYSGTSKHFPIPGSCRSDSREETAAKAEEARRAGISLFAIGVGQGVDETELAAIGSEPKEEYVFTVNNYDALNTIKELLSMKACEGETSTW